MMIRLICRNWLYWVKLTLIAVLSLLVLNSMTILDDYNIVTVPKATEETQQIRPPRSMKWIIIDNTDINESHEKLINDNKGWSGIIMDSTKSRQTLRCEHCLSREPIDGVMEAIKNNAQFIYYSDNAFTLDSELSELRLTPLSYGLDFIGNVSHFDLESHFKRTKNTSPLSQNLQNHYRLGGWRTPLIQTIVPASMLLNPGESAEDIDSRAVPIILPKRYYHPFAQKGSLYTYDAFWALVPIDRKYYFTWSLMTERLLEELASEVGFSPPSVNKPTLNNEMIDHKKIAELSQILKHWVCLPLVSFFKCIETLSDLIVTAGHLPQAVSSLTKTFLATLETSGYKQPVRIFLNLPRPFVPPINRIIYWPAKAIDRSPQVMNKSFLPMCAQGINTCQEKGKIPGSKIPYYDNLLLVVVFNRPGHYGVVDYLERMYRPFFPQMIYCGHDMNNFLSVYNLLKKKVSFIEVDFNLGQYGYQCLQKAMQMKFDVDGYIHLSDDVLLNVWNVAQLPKDKIWFQKNMRIAQFIMHVVPDIWKHSHWGPWTTVYGKTAAKGAIAALTNLALLEKRATDFMFMLTTNVGGPDRVYYEASDIFYIPKRFAGDFIYFASVFDASHVHLEIAVPTILNGLDLNENIVTMNGSYLWYQDRGLYQTKYNYHDMYMHSVKLGPCIAEATCQKFICNRFISCLYTS